MVNSQHTPEDGRAHPSTLDDRQRLSALMDGELGSADGAATCEAWRGDGALRAEWHAWHLIGDALRSDDLATAPSRDRAFVEAFRTRLAAEPAVLAPLPVAPRSAVREAPVGAGAATAPARRRPHWMVAPTAIAAGFVVVAGATMVMRNSTSSPSASSTLAAASAPAALGEQARLEALAGARLDRYLAAHRRLAGGSSGVASGQVHQVELLVVEGK